MKCPYCGINYYSGISFNVHIQNCLYKGKPLTEQEIKMVDILIYENMKYGELKSIANTKGITANKMKKEDIIKALNGLED